MELGMKPVFFEENGRFYAAYSSTRLTLREDAWDGLPESGRILNLICPRGASFFWVRLSKSDIRNVFANVLDSVSWQRDGVYHYSRFPSKAEPFVVPVESLPARCRDWTCPSTGARKAPKIPEAVRQASTVHEWAEAWSNVVGTDVDSSQYLDSVRAWRHAWRPDVVRFLLVAESHVAQQEGDTDIQVRVPNYEDLPSGFCRLVYCFGYGESDLCHPRPQSNPGTRQFWDILGSIAFEEQQPRKEKSSTRERLEWKLAVLGKLRRMGVWLEDASPVAFYSSGGERPLDGSYGSLILRDGFERFVWPGVEGDGPEQIWVIGKGVGKALDGHPAIRQDRVIRQPQSRDAEQYRQELDRMVRSIRGAYGC